MTVGNAAFTKKATVATILIVGAGVVVGAGVGVGTLLSVGTGACATQASPMIPEANNAITKGRVCM